MPYQQGPPVEERRDPAILQRWTDLGEDLRALPSWEPPLNVDAMMQGDEPPIHFPRVWEDVVWEFIHLTMTYMDGRRLLGTTPRIISNEEMDDECPALDDDPEETPRAFNRGVGYLRPIRLEEEPAVIDERFFREVICAVGIPRPMSTPPFLPQPRGFSPGLMVIGRGGRQLGHRGYFPRFNMTARPIIPGTLDRSPTMADLTEYFATMEERVDFILSAVQSLVANGRFRPRAPLGGAVMLPARPGRFRATALTEIAPGQSFQIFGSF